MVCFGTVSLKMWWWTTDLVIITERFAKEKLSNKRSFSRNYYRSCWTDSLKMATRSIHAPTLQPVEVIYDIVFRQARIEMGE